MISNPHFSVTKPANKEYRIRTACGEFIGPPINSIEEGNIIALWLNQAFELEVSARLARIVDEHTPIMDDEDATIVDSIDSIRSTL